MLKYLFSRIPEDLALPNILLVDDDRDIRTVTSLVLLTSGIGNVYEASSGNEGLEMARRQRPDIILLDMKLPDMGGDTVLQVLKTDPWTQEIPVVLFTASARASQLRHLPVAGIILKPFHPPELCEVIRQTLGRENGPASKLSRNAPAATPRYGVPGNERMQPANAGASH